MQFIDHLTLVLQSQRQITLDLGMMSVRAPTQTHTPHTHTNIVCAIYFQQFIKSHDYPGEIDPKVTIVKSLNSCTGYYLK